MKLYNLSKIGTFHVNHNEDAYAITEIGSDKIVIAVMDGCSMGKESHFASILIAKLLRKIGKEISFRAFAERTIKTTSEYLDEVIESLFQGLGQIKNELHLEREEMLSTLILGILDKSLKEMELLTIGDGLICCNKQLYEYEQDDKPDYLGYHLQEDFQQWYPKQTQKLSLKNVQDISISTDGIFTFKHIDNKTYNPITENEIIDFLLIDTQWSDKENMLSKKVLAIEENFGLKPSDDLTIIRVNVG